MIKKKKKGLNELAKIIEEDHKSPTETPVKPAESTRAQPEKSPKIPTVKINGNLPVIKEEEDLEHNIINNEDLSPTDNSEYSYRSDREAEISRLNLLPYMTRDESRAAYALKPQTNDPMMNFFFRVANSFKLNAAEIIEEAKSRD